MAKITLSHNGELYTFGNVEIDSISSTLTWFFLPKSENGLARVNHFVADGLFHAVHCDYGARYFVCVRSEKIAPDGIED